MAKSTPRPGNLDNAPNLGGGLGKVTGSAPKTSNPIAMGNPGPTQRPASEFRNSGQGRARQASVRVRDQGSARDYVSGKTQSAGAGTTNSEVQGVLGQSGSYVGQIMAGRPSAMVGAQSGSGLYGGGSGNPASNVASRTVNAGG